MKKKQHINTVSAASYLELNRIWRDQDNIRLVFHYDFHLKPMPDNPNTFAIYYGPMLLAFESKSEVILKGETKEILKNLSVSDLKKATFQLTNNNKNYQLRPLYDIDNQSYGVYATIKNY